MVGLLVVLALLAAIFGRRTLLRWLDAVWTGISVLILVGLCIAFPALAIGLGCLVVLIGGWFCWDFWLRDAVQENSEQHRKRQQEAVTEEQVARLKRLLAAGDAAAVEQTCREMAAQRTLFQAVRPLLLAVADTHGSIRNCGLVGLKLCAESGISTGSAARERLADDTEWTINRVLAADIVGANLDGEGLVALYNALSDPEPQVRSAAALGLGPSARSHYGLPVTDWLLPLLDDPDLEVRLSAVQALGISGDPKALRPLQAVNADPRQSQTVREAAQAAVAALRQG